DIPGFDKCFPLSRIDDVVAQSDIVVICLPHTDETKYLFNKERFEKMKPDACLINVSRGAIINEQDLIYHLEQGKFKGVALDVFEKEPLPKYNKL
ncbi:hydroxyacid dehydrogenase, partial [Algoriphagus aestuarii]|nr:hydroxyacid dehydrogenase [Algoriphagus aestuarii]